MRYVVTHDGVEHELEVREEEDGTFTVTLGGEELAADFARVDGHAIFSLLLEGRSHEMLIFQDGEATSVIHHGHGADVQVESERERNARLISAEAGADGASSVTAVMPGIVISVAVAEGDVVAKGDALVVLEAMKMENEIRAAAGGRVERVRVAPGETVNAGDVLVEIADE